MLMMQRTEKSTKPERRFLEDNLKETLILSTKTCDTGGLNIS